MGAQLRCTLAASVDLARKSTESAVSGGFSAIAIASVSCVILLVVDGAASFAVAVDLAGDLTAGFTADFVVALDVAVGLGDGAGDGTSSSSEAPSSTHLSTGQKPEAQLALHHCASPESPLMLVHVWGCAEVGAGEGCSGMATLA